MKLLLGIFRELGPNNIVAVYEKEISRLLSI